jgi:hypothetical protein
MAAPGKLRSARKPEVILDRDTRSLELKKMRQLINRLRGRCKGEDSLVDALYRERQEKSVTERTWGCWEEKLRAETS